MRIIGAARSLKLLRARREPINFPSHFVSQLRALRELVISSNSTMFSARILNIDRECIPKTLRVLRLKTNTSFGALTHSAEPDTPFDLATLFPFIEEIELCAPLDSSMNATESLGKRLLSFSNCSVLTSLVLHRVEVEGPHINVLPPSLTKLQLAMFDDWVGPWHEVKFPPLLQNLSLFQIRRYQGFFEQLESCCPDLASLHATWSYPEDKLGDSHEETFWSKLPRNLTSITVLGGPSTFVKEGALLLPPSLEELSLMVSGLDVTALDVLPKSLTSLSIRDVDSSYNRKGIVASGAEWRQVKYPGSVTSRQVSWSTLPPNLRLISLDISAAQGPAGVKSDHWPFMKNLIELPTATRPLSPDDKDTSYLTPLNNSVGLASGFHLLPQSLTKLRVADFKLGDIMMITPITLTSLSLQWDYGRDISTLVSDDYYRAIGQIKTLQHLTMTGRPNLLKLHHIGRTLETITIAPLGYGTSNLYAWFAAAALDSNSIASSGIPHLEQLDRTNVLPVLLTQSFGISQSWTFARKIFITSPSSAFGLCQIVQLLPSSMPALETLSFGGDDGRNQNAFPMLSQKCPSLTELIVGGLGDLVFADLAALPQTIKYLSIDGIYGGLEATAADLVRFTPRDLIEFSLAIKFTLLPSTGKDDTPDNAPRHAKAALAHIRSVKPLWRSFTQAGCGPFHLSWQRPMSSSEFDSLARKSLE